MRCCGCTNVTCPTCGGAGVVPAWPYWSRPWVQPWPVVPRPRPILVRPIVVETVVVPVVVPGMDRSRGARRDLAAAMR